MFSVMKNAMNDKTNNVIDICGELNDRAFFSGWGVLNLRRFDVYLIVGVLEFGVRHGGMSDDFRESARSLGRELFKQLSEEGLRMGEDAKRAFINTFELEGEGFKEL